MNSIRVANNNLPTLWLLLLGFNYYGLVISASAAGVGGVGNGTTSPPNLPDAALSLATEKHEVAGHSVAASSNGNFENSNYEPAGSGPYPISENTNETEPEAETRNFENKRGDAQFPPAKNDPKEVQKGSQLISPTKAISSEIPAPQTNSSLSEAEELKGGDQRNPLLSLGHATSGNQIQSTAGLQNTSHTPPISNEVNGMPKQFTTISPMHDKHPSDGNDTTIKLAPLTPPKMPEMHHEKPMKNDSDRKAIEGPYELPKNELTTKKSLARDKELIITVGGSKSEKDTNNIDARRQTIPGTLFEVAFGIAVFILGFYIIAKTWFIHSGRPKILACCFCDCIYYGITDAFLWIWNLLKSCGRWLCVRSPIAVSRPGFKGMRKTESTRDLADADADSYSSL